MVHWSDQFRVGLKDIVTPTWRFTGDVGELGSWSSCLTLRSLYLMEAWNPLPLRPRPAMLSVD